MFNPAGPCDRSSLPRSRKSADQCGAGGLDLFPRHAGVTLVPVPRGCQGDNPIRHPLRCVFHGNERRIPGCDRGRKKAGADLAQHGGGRAELLGLVDRRRRMGCVQVGGSQERMQGQVRNRCQRGTRRLRQLRRESIDIGQHHRMRAHPPRQPVGGPDNQRVDMFAPTLVGKVVRLQSEEHLRKTTTGLQRPQCGSLCGIRREVSSFK